MRAFQAHDKGSIPFRRSILKVENMLEVYDNLFEPRFLIDCHIAARNISWHYGNKSGSNQYPYNSALSQGNHIFLGALLYHRKSRYYTVNNTPPIFIEVLEHIVKDVICDHSLNLYQIEGNLQFYGQAGTAHQDVYVGNGKDRTILFYPNLEWNETLGGELEILDDHDTIVERILPLPGRVVYFDSTIKHRAVDPCIVNTPRFSIAYRMEKPFSTAG
jgi:hypothetical protein